MPVLFLCIYDSRYRVSHYVKQDWPPQTNMGLYKASNILTEFLFKRDQIIFPSLQIKLGLIKQFFKTF